MKICVVGTGYVGLVSGVCFAELGHDVICIDRDRSKIARLQSGEVPIYEPGLDAMLRRNAERHALRFTTDLATAVAESEAVLIAVGTPNKSDGTADLSQVYSVARDLARVLTGFTVVITKSTVPVGTNKEVERIIREVGPECDFEVASNPEFLREGAAIDDFMQPDRVVYGVTSDRAANVLDRIYQRMIDRGHTVQRTNLETAEMIKYASNAFLATKVTFVNELSALCEEVGADVRQLVVGMGSDKRIGDKFLHPGPGYGGSCFPKDTRAIASTGRNHARPQSIVETVIAANEATKTRMIDKIVQLCDGSVAGKRIAVLGATFKADTDDMREAPSLTILSALVRAGAEIRLYDPQGRRHGMAQLPHVNWCDHPLDAADRADALVVLTDWSEFRELDLEQLARSMATARLADLRNIFDEDRAIDAGFETVVGVGYPMRRARRIPAETSGPDKNTPRGERASQDSPKADTIQLTEDVMTRFSGKRVLITGAAGFLGSHLTDRFLASGCEVVGLDNLMSGSLINLAQAREHARFDFIEADVVKPYDVACDLVVNLACPASPPRYQADPLHTMRTSVHGAFNACDVALRNGARLVHSSTSEIYGDPECHPQQEEYRGLVNPIGIRACYDEGKRAAETVLFDYNRFKGLEIGVCRIFNTYGPRMDPYDGRVVSNFVRQALLGEPLTIYGEGQQTRSFCFADDLVEGIWRLCHADADLKGPINLGNPVEITVLELAETIREKIGAKVRLDYQPLPADDPTRRKPDISRAQRDLGWSPQIALSEGLDRTIAYFDGLIRDDKLAEFKLRDSTRYSTAAE